MFFFEIFSTFLNDPVVIILLTSFDTIVLYIKLSSYTFSFFYDDESQHTEIGVNNAASHGLALPLSVTPGSVARVAFGQEQTNTTWIWQHTISLDEKSAIWSWF